MTARETIEVIKKDFDWNLWRKHYEQLTFAAITSRGFRRVKLEAGML